MMPKTMPSRCGGRLCWMTLGALLLTVLLAGGCGQTETRLFNRLGAEQTGIDFTNTVATDDSLMNPMDFFYVYNGGGVAFGDLNGDGRSDLYFSGNAVSNRLYLNQGALQFREITAQAGVAASGAWATGVTRADVNQDGRQDLYVSVGGPSSVTESRANRLYVNQGTGSNGIPRFKERADAYGIADSGYTTHAGFFDYDRDGDLDLYVLNTATVGRRGRSQRGAERQGPASATDRLYRNQGDGTFTEVSQSAGLAKGGYGLGLAIRDINDDGWPDIYVANDLHVRDRLYLNQGDGTFADRSRTYLRHQSYSAMGVDVADVNNDTRKDILVLDMLPKEPRRRRLISNSGARTDGMWQYGRNTLQLNNGTGTEGLGPFSEIGQLTNVEATGWSWAPLLADYDNDGDRDLFVTNGFGELVTHLDFVRRREQARFSGTRQENRASLYKALRELPTVDLPNRLFENVGGPGKPGSNLRFADRTETWASSAPGISNGAAFGDLDRDGDLDLVTNNINRTATVLENRMDERAGGHALRVDLHGPQGNRAGHGTEVVLKHGGTTQSQEYSPYRGYQSTVESRIHFGLGADSTADVLKVVWPDGTTQRRTGVDAGQVVDVHYDSTGGAQGPSSVSRAEDSGPLSDSSLVRMISAGRRGLAHRHRAFTVRDFQMNPLLPHRYSGNGPGIAVGDVDGNGLDDVFVGADPKRKRRLYRQVEPGRFASTPLTMVRSHEDMGALFFDAEGDGDPDLYVVSGGNAGPPDNNRNTYQDRLYLNDGTGAFRRAENALPDITASGSVVTAADYDRDGDLDLFVGGRVKARHYPLPPRSYLLRNDSGPAGVQFRDVTAEAAPALSKAGLVTDALWTDFSGDGRVDLLVVGEWMPIRFFRNDDGQFAEVTEETGLPPTAGWWNSLAGGDFDRDGDLDYVVGNLGLNTRYQASPDAPVRVHAKDFDQNDTVDPILSYYLQDKNYPAHGRQELIDKILGMRGRVPTQQDYAEATIEDVLTDREREGAYTATAVRFETSYLENRGDGTFALRALPRRVQTAPVFGIQPGDYTGDGVLDVLMVGNWYAPDAETGRADAFLGAVLRGDGTGHFTPLPYPKSGLLVPGDAKALAWVATGSGRPLGLATQNDDSLKAFVSTRPPREEVRVRPLDRFAELQYPDGTTETRELYYGSTYLSQSSRCLWVPPRVESVVIHGADGARRAELSGE